MTERTWVILGATSIIAEEFAHLAAQAGQKLVLAGRHEAQLNIMEADLRLRYKIDCHTILTDFSADLTRLLEFFSTNQAELDLFIAYSHILQNDELTTENIKTLIDTNVLSTTQIIHTYFDKPQTQHRLLFLSSVAACRGRAKNSLYGATKAAIELYLEGLRQAELQNRQITIARLGFIDTIQTFGAPGIFYASPPKACAQACWRAIQQKKHLIYHPFFWRFIMGIISRLPFFLYKKMGGL